MAYAPTSAKRSTATSGARSTSHAGRLGQRRGVRRYSLQHVRAANELDVQARSREVWSSCPPFAVERGVDRRRIPLCHSDGQELVIVDIKISKKRRNFRVGARWRVRRRDADSIFGSLERPPIGRVYFDGKTMYVKASKPRNPFLHLANLDEPLGDVSMSARVGWSGGAKD